MPGSGTASYSGTPPPAGQAMAIPPQARVRRQLTKRQRQARDYREAILLALGYTGKLDTRAYTPDIVKNLKRAGAYSGGPVGRTPSRASSSVGGARSATPLPLGGGTLAQLVSEARDPRKQRRRTRRPTARRSPPVAGSVGNDIRMLFG